MTEVDTRPVRGEIRGFDHVAITVSDLDAACRFYETVLDGRLEADYQVNGRTIVRRVSVGRAILNLHQQGNGVTLVARCPTVGSADLCFRWHGGIESAMLRLEEAGIAVREGPVPRVACDDSSGQSVYFNDPDGNLIELLATSSK